MQESTLCANEASICVTFRADARLCFGSHLRGGQREQQGQDGSVRTAGSGRVQGATASQAFRLCFNKSQSHRLLQSFGTWDQDGQRCKFQGATRFKIFYFKDPAEAGHCQVYNSWARHAATVNFMCHREPRCMVRHYFWVGLRGCF